MDALSFAMGERAASLRVRHLRDLIHGAHIGQPVSNTARVAMRYCSDEDQETVFCRTITGQMNLVLLWISLHVTIFFYFFIKAAVCARKIHFLVKEVDCMMYSACI